MKYFFLILMLNSFLILSCGRHDKQTDLNPRPQRILTEQEKSYLATPTIYFVPSFDRVTAVACNEGEKVNLLDRQGRFIARVCKTVYRACQLNGTCRIQMLSEFALLNVDRVDSNGTRRFVIVRSPNCVFGLGAANDGLNRFKEMCLDPFYSVAADLKIYRLGDVIYFPSLVGVVLPDGSLHNGHMIVRDSGGRIIGPGRFDFFTGFVSLNRNENPFAQLGLGGGGNFFPDYAVVTGNKANQHRMARAFPFLRN